MCQNTKFVNYGFQKFIAVTAVFTNVVSFCLFSIHQTLNHCLETLREKDINFKDIKTVQINVMLPCNFSFCSLIFNSFATDVVTAFHKI